MKDNKMNSFPHETDKLNKDKYKAELADGFIGFGVENSATWHYEQWAKENGLLCNSTNSNEYRDKTIWVSVNGGNKTTQENLDKTFELCLFALEHGAVLIMDSNYHARRVYNRKGELALQNRLEEVEYVAKLSHYEKESKQMFNLFHLDF